METEPGEVEVAEEERQEHPEESGPETPVEASGEPERRLDEEDPEAIEDPESHGEGPASTG